MSVPESIPLHDPEFMILLPLLDMLQLVASPEIVQLKVVAEPLIKDEGLLIRLTVGGLIG